MMLTLECEINAAAADKLSQISPVVGLYHTICPGGNHRSAAVVFLHMRQMEREAAYKLCGVQKMVWLGDLDLAFKINVGDSENIRENKLW